MKKIFTFILFSMIAFNTIHAEIAWTLSEDGILTISGTDMPDYQGYVSYNDDYGDYHYGDYPWCNQRYKVKKVIIEKGVTNIGNYAFCGCTSLTSITIPNSVTSIGGGAFEVCSALTSITIPNSVTSIGGSAFYGCTGLTSITIPNSVMSIEGMAFARCSSFTSVTIPNSVTSIRAFAFENCSGLTSITISNSVTSIGNYAFNGCSGITSIICEATTPPTCSNSSYENVNKSIPLYVPANSIDAYKKASVWKEFTNIQAIPDTYTFIDGCVYTNSELPVYDLNGRKVNENSLKPGIYVRNGKAFVVK